MGLCGGSADVSLWGPYRSLWGQCGCLSMGPYRSLWVSMRAVRMSLYGVPIGLPGSLWGQCGCLSMGPYRSLWGQCGCLSMGPCGVSLGLNAGSADVSLWVPIGLPGSLWGQCGRLSMGPCGVSQCVPVVPSGRRRAHRVSTVKQFGCRAVPPAMPGPWTRTLLGSQPSVTATRNGPAGSGEPPYETSTVCTPGGGGDVTVTSAQRRHGNVVPP